MSDLRYFGTFPFCPRIIESEDEIETINEEVAQRWVENMNFYPLGTMTQPYQYKDYWGSLYPLKLNLGDAMRFFWKLQRVEFDFEWNNSDSNGSFASITNAEWYTDFSINTFEDLFLKRVCNEKNPLVWTGRRTQVSPPATIDNTFLLRLFDSTIGSAIGSEFGGTGISGPPILNIKTSGSNFVPVLDDVDQMLALFDGGDINNPNDYWYYPMIFFEAATAGTGASSFGPLWEYQFRVTPTIRFKAKNKTFSTYSTNFNGDNFSFEDSSIDLFIIESCTQQVLPSVGTESCTLSTTEVPSTITLDGGFNVVTFND